MAKMLKLSVEMKISANAEIVTLLGEAHQRVMETLTAKRELLDSLAQALQEKETVNRAALDDHAPSLHRYRFRASFSPRALSGEHRPAD